MSEKEQKQWYVLRAIGGKEKKVKEYLETEIKTPIWKTISPKF